MRLEILLIVAGLAVGAAAAPAGLPLCFEENRGQVDDQVQYLARCPGYQLFLTRNEAVLGLPGTSTPVRLSFVGAARHPVVVGVERLPGIVSYFLGDEPEKWVSGAPTFASVECVELYPGIDLVWRGAPGGELEFDLRLAPGVDPAVIEMQIDGACDARLTDGGDLALEVESGLLVIGAPRVFQDGEPVPASLELRDGDGGSTWSVIFAIASHDPARPILVDPVVTFSTYLGGAGWEQVLRLAVDAQGNAILGGRTTSLDFPIVGGVQLTSGGSLDGFVCKLDPTGQTLLYSTFLGGAGDDAVADVEVDPTGGVVLVGYTESASYPTVSPIQPALAGTIDCIVGRLDATGSILLYSSYFGGTGVDTGRGVGVDAANRIYISGDSESFGLPMANPLQAVQPGGTSTFMTCFDPAGATLVYSTYLGGSSFDNTRDMDVDAAGNATMVGSTGSPDFPLLNPIRGTRGGTGDAFVTRFSPTGVLVYSTYLGGAVPFTFGANAIEVALGVAVDALGNATIVGWTTSSDFPMLNPFQPSFAGGPADTFVTRLTPSGALAYSTYLGGSSWEYGVGVDVDSGGDAWVCGHTASLDFPLLNPLQSSFSGGLRDGLVFELSADGSTLLFSTYIGGAGEDYPPAIGLDADDNAFVGGYTESVDFPVANPLQPLLDGTGDATVLRLDQGIHVRVITPLQDPVAQGQIGLTIQMDVENTSASTALVDTLGLSFRDAMGGDRDVDTMVIPQPGNPTTIAGGATETFDFFVDVAPGAQLGIITIDGSIGVTDTLTGEVRADPTASVPGSWEVVGALPFVRTITAAPTTVLRGWSGYAVSVNVENVGQNDIDVTSLALSFAGTVDRTADYIVTPDMGNPLRILAGQTQPFLFAVDVSVGAALEFVTIDAAFDGVDSVSMSAVSDPGADVTDAWTVIGTAYIRTIDAVPTTVLQGSSAHPVSVTVENVGDDRIDLVSLTLSFTGLVDRTGEYTVTPDPGNPTGIAGGATEIFMFTVDVSPAAALELITLDASFAGIDTGSMQPVADADADTTDTWTVVAGEAFVRVVDTPVTTVLQGASGQPVTVSVENAGLNDMSVNAVALSFTGLVDRTGEYTVTPDPGNPTGIAGGATEIFTFTVDVSPAAALELITLDASFAGIDTGSMQPVADADADVTDTWTVVAGEAFVRVVDTPVTTVLQGASGHPVAVSVENAGLNDMSVSAVALSFTGTADRTSEYTVTPDPGNPSSITGGATEIFTFTVDVSPAAALELITLDASFAGIDAGSMQPVADADADTTDTWTVVACLALSCGDCNGDGVLNILDSLAAALHSASIVFLVGESFSNCNVTGILEPMPGAAVDVLDSLLLAQIAAGLPVALSCC